MNLQLHTEICTALINKYEARFITALVIQYYAQRWTPNQILKKLEKEHDIHVTRTAVTSIIHRNREIIAQLKAEKDL